MLNFFPNFDRKATNLAFFCDLQLHGVLIKLSARGTQLRISHLRYTLLCSQPNVLLLKRFDRLPMASALISMICFGEHESLDHKNLKNKRKKDELGKISMRDITMKHSNRDSTRMRTVTAARLRDCISNMASQNGALDNKI